MGFLLRSQNETIIELHFKEKRGQTMKDLIVPCEITKGDNLIVETAPKGFSITVEERGRPCGSRFSEVVISYDSALALSDYLFKELKL